MQVGQFAKNVEGPRLNFQPVPGQHTAAPELKLRVALIAPLRDGFYFRQVVRLVGKPHRVLNGFQQPGVDFFHFHIKSILLSTNAEFMKQRKVNQR